jgi:alpha-beta hydrolase superfamily lysophospholipase
MEKVDAVVVLSPALAPRLALKDRLVLLARRVTPSLFSKLAGWEGEVIEAMEFVRSRVRSIEAPVLAIQAQDDSRLSTRGLRWVRQCARHPGSEIVVLPEGGHVLTRGVARDEVFRRIQDFLAKTFASPGR